MKLHAILHSVCVCVMITHNVIKYFITYCLDRGFKEEFSEY